MCEPPSHPRVHTIHNTVTLHHGGTSMLALTYIENHVAPFGLVYGETNHDAEWQVWSSSDHR